MTNEIQDSNNPPTAVRQPEAIATSKAETTTASQPETVAPAPKYRGAEALVWIALLLTLAAWGLLMWVDGYVALATGIAAVAASLFATVRARGGWRRLAIALLIASLVLVVVLSAFIIVIKVGMGQ